MARDLSDEAKELTTRGNALIAQARTAIECSNSLCSVAQESIRTARELIADAKTRRAQLAKKVPPI
jgi:hypothetical protein